MSRIFCSDVRRIELLIVAGILAVGAYSCSSSEAPGSVAHVVVTPGSESLNEGDTVRLKATAVDADSREIPGKGATWKSDNQNVATVDAGGLVQAVGGGSATITATIDGVPGTASMTISARVAKVTVNLPSGDSLIERASGQAPMTLQLNATLTDKNNDTLTNRTVTWSSLTTSIATVDPATGLVTAVAPGTATIQAKSSEGPIGTAAIRVLPRVARLLLALPDSNMPLGVAATPTLAMFDVQNQPITGRPVAWSVSDAAIADVASSGTVTGKAHGSASVIATVEAQSTSLKFTVVTAWARVFASNNVTVCALSTESYAYCWGYTELFGAGPGPYQLCINSGSPFPCKVAPSLVDSTRTFRQLSLGSYGSCGVTTGNDVYCWGGTLANNPSLVLVQSGAARIATESSTLCFQPVGGPPVLTQCGSLGSSTFTQVDPGGLLTGHDLFAGGQFACILDDTLHLGCFGDNVWQELGIADTTSSVPHPQTNVLVNNPRFVTLGNAFGCAITQSGASVCWGKNSSGEWGNGQVSTTATMNLGTVLGGPYSYLAAGVGYGCGIDMSAAAYCWGNVPNGATRASNATPTPVAGNIKFANLATGSDFVCGVSTDKRMYCWGNNTFGQLGDGTVVAHAAPARVAIVP